MGREEIDMEILIFTIVCWGTGYALVVCGDKTGNSTLNTLGFLMFGVWIIGIIVMGGGSGGLEPQDVWRAD